MRQRPLGQSGISASVVGLGAWAMGGWMWGGTDESDSIRAIHSAIDIGMNLIDTAPIYGFGLSEIIVGRAIRDRRDKVVLATKCGLVCNPGVGEPFFRTDGGASNPLGIIFVNKYLGPQSIRRELEDSLQRLQTDRIDLYQTHWQDSTTPVEDAMGVLLDLKREGKIRAIGVSNATCAHMERYRAVGPIDSDQERYSMIDRAIENEQLPYCRRHGIAVLAYSPLGQGLLTGKVGRDRQFKIGDLRRFSALFAADSRERVMTMLEKLRPIAEDRGLTLGQLAIAWVLNQPGLTHALCGARNPQQVRENAAAGDVDLGAREMRAIAKAIEPFAPAKPA